VRDRGWDHARERPVHAEVKGWDRLAPAECDRRGDPRHLQGRGQILVLADRR
jgi:hypothetical protein